MMGATNDFYLFMYDNFYLFKNQEYVGLDDAWKLYCAYCEDAKVRYVFGKRSFREEMKNYFSDFVENVQLDDGTKYRNAYKGLRVERFQQNSLQKEQDKIQQTVSWITSASLEDIPSTFDKECKDCPAQYAVFVDDRDKPTTSWALNKDILSGLDTSKLHYVKIPINHIVIDFDLKDESGNKCLEKNILAANRFPPTYAEISKGGQGLHLHYIYDGDPTELDLIYDEDIEVKVFKGNSSLRRKLTKCNRLSITHINSGLPKKEVKSVVSKNNIKTERKLREMIEKNLRKEYMHYTKPSIDFIKKILDDAYESELKYDLRDMIDMTMSFAMSSNNSADYCVKQVAKMKWKSKEDTFDDIPFKEDIPIIFFDVEVFPNLFIICWKRQGKENEVVGLINPAPAEVLKLTHYKLIGFNNRQYDNHMLYARINGYSEMELYKLSQAIIGGDKSAKFGAAYNLSYTDIFDFASNKQSLKKYEIEIGIHHQELGFSWDEPVPEDMWDKVVEYCKNDVIATEATFNYLKDDWFGREMLVDMANLLCKSRTSTVNDTTNTLTARIIFGGNQNPQSQFNYRDLSKPVRWDDSMRQKFRKRIWHLFNETGQPAYKTFDPDKDKVTDIPEGWSIMPFFPDYTFDFNRKEKSLYLGEEVGEGGRVYAEPGMYGDVYLDDIASMHPSSIEAEDLFGPEYTQRFADLKQIRIDIKHGDIDAAKGRLGGALAELFNREDFNPKKLSKALKIPINAVYGQTSAKFQNVFRDSRNIDNIVAKRGALFMMNLEKEVKKRGFTVAHIKTDSIKIPDATKEIMDFVEGYGREYGYNFEHEATYEKMCLVNNAVYIAKYKWSDDKDTKPGTWTATGTQFRVPYVFKSLFSKQPLTFDDFCVTQESKTGALYLDFGNEAEHDYRFVGKVGQFTPVKNGGSLVAKRINKKTGETTYVATPGSTGYKWIESETIRNDFDMAQKNDILDMSYFKALTDAAIASIENYGGFEWFVSDIPYDKENNDILPF